MATFAILAGDFGKTPSPTIAGQTLRLPKPPHAVSWKMLFGVTKWEPVESIHAAEIASLEVVGQASGKSFGGAAAAGIAGDLLLGGIGAVAGVLAGGNKDAVTFQLTLRDGRALLGSAKPTAFQKIQAVEFACRGQEPPPKVEIGPPKPVTGKGIAVRVGLVALLLAGVYVGMTILVARVCP